MLYVDPRCLLSPERQLDLISHSLVLLLRKYVSQNILYELCSVFYNQNLSFIGSPNFAQYFEA